MSLGYEVSRKESGEDLQASNSIPSYEKYSELLRYL